MTIPDFENKADLIDYLVEHKDTLIAQKKAHTKYADAVGGPVSLITEKGEAIKTESVPATVTKIKVRSIINTTKLLDSHGDVHIDQLWNKSLKENTDHHLVKQHQFDWENTISDDVKAFTKQISWAELGFNYEGKTQALVFDSVISKEDSPMMFEKYRQGRVKQHSVGMQYVKTNLAVNDDRYEEEKKLWDKYYPEIANKETVMEQGYFWAVTEAKVIEGSAVKKGSNFATPTYSVEEKTEPSTDTLDEPLKDTQNKVNVDELLNNFKI